MVSAGFVYFKCRRVYIIHETAGEAPVSAHNSVINRKWPLPDIASCTGRFCVVSLSDVSSHSILLLLCFLLFLPVKIIIIICKLHLSSSFSLSSPLSLQIYILMYVYFFEKNIWNAKKVKQNLLNVNVKGGTSKRVKTSKQVLNQR